jgi:3-hydroxyacyl-[acyl-carrier-protein] dehydratase
MTRDEIESAIPHRGPMLLVDEVISREPSKIVCRKTFHPDEFFFQGHYPEYPLVPGIILCECAMQAGGVLLAGRIGDVSGAPVATRMNNVRFRQMVRPGETIEMEVELQDEISSAYYLAAKVRCNNKIAMRMEFACTIARQFEE